MSVDFALKLAFVSDYELDLVRVIQHKNQDMAVLGVLEHLVPALPLFNQIVDYILTAQA